MTTPDKRLLLCASFVRRGSTFADIGTDHAYLPVWLCKNGIVPHAIAADINPRPLESGAKAVALAGLGDKIELRLSDGLKNISENEADDIVVAGMGGELIADIIEACPYSKNKSKRFILQPMTKSEQLIIRLCESGFRIIAQDCAEAGGKCYTVICAEFSGEKREYGELYPYLGELSPGSNPLHEKFVLGHIKRLEKQAVGDSSKGELADKLRETITKQSD